jgi:hypothetical protein
VGMVGNRESGIESALRLGSRFPFPVVPFPVSPFPVPAVGTSDLRFPLPSSPLGPTPIAHRGIRTQAILQTDCILHLDAAANAALLDRDDQTAGNRETEAMSRYRDSL